VGFGDNRHVQTPTDYVGDVSKRPVETCSIEQVHRGLAVKLVADKR
jgi:hypothetical protein